MEINTGQDGSAGPQPGEASPSPASRSYRIKGHAEVESINVIQATTTLALDDLYKAELSPEGATAFIQKQATLAATQLEFLWNKFKDQFELIEGE